MNDEQSTPSMPSAPATSPTISEREREILTIVARGATNQQVAQELNISVHTVRVHLRNIFTKIGVASRTEATVYALRHGLLTVDVMPGDAALETPPEVSLHAATITIEPKDRPTSHPEATSPEVATAVTPLPTPIPLSETHDVSPVMAPVKPVEPITPVDTTVPTVATTNNGMTYYRHTTLLVFLVAIIFILTTLLLYTTLFRPLASTAMPTMFPLHNNASIDSSTKNWHQRSALPMPREQFAVVHYRYDGKVYVIGGRTVQDVTGSVDRYDPVYDVWVSLPPKPLPVSHIQAVAMGGFLYVPGGEDANGTVLSHMEAFNPRTQQWLTLPDLPAPRSRYALASVEGKLYLFGGWDGNTACDDVFIYAPEEHTWTTGDPMPTARLEHTAALLEGRIYVIGGKNEHGVVQVNERYDVTSQPGKQWESVAPLPIAMIEPSAATMVETIFVFGHGTDYMAQYNPDSDVWNTLRLPQTVAAPIDVVSLSTSVLLFGDVNTETPGAITEYQVLYQTFLPNISRP